MRGHLLLLLSVCVSFVLASWFEFKSGPSGKKLKPESVLFQAQHYLPILLPDSHNRTCYSYLYFLPERSCSEEAMFEGIRRMLTVDSVTSYGQLVRGGRGGEWRGEGRGGEGRGGEGREGEGGGEGRGSGYVVKE